MKNKLRVLSALCAVIMSVSVITPTYALPESDVNFLEKRFQIANNYLSNNYRGIDDRIFSDLKNILEWENNSFNSTRNFLLSSENDEAHASFLKFHNAIDQVFNSVNLNKLKLFDDRVFDVKNAELSHYNDEFGFSNSLFNTFSLRMSQLNNVVFKNSFKGQRCINLLERLRQLKIRFSFYFKELCEQFNLRHFRTLEQYVQPLQQFRNEFVEEFNGLVNDMNDINDINGFVEKDMCNFNSRIDQLHRVIDKFNMFKKIVFNKIENGIYTIESKLDNNKCLDIQYASEDNGANLQLFEKNSTSAQKFKVKYNKEADYYTITAMCSKKPLDVALAGKDWGTNIQQYSYNNNDAQKWYIVPDGQGYYSIVSKYNGLCMDVSNANTANGTNIQCWGANETDAQKFKLVKS